MNVTKALVIGLGSSGTDICSRLLQRIEWELDSADNAPWVRVVCFETNASGRPANIKPEDFCGLNISAMDWDNIKKNASAWEEAIGLQTWADMDTLKCLPDTSINAGAGNIRMVGRIALLFPANFTQFVLAVHHRLISLQSLTSLKASEELPDRLREQGEKVFFTGNGGNPVIYVVGTLCGGTCSGIAADVGFLLRAKTPDDCYKLGLFTLPHPGLTAVHAANAERLKKNAYAALVEMNHYHYQKDISITFPDKTKVSSVSPPYDYLFVASPKSPGDLAVDELHTAIADYIFLNIFAPGTLPMALGVDAGVKFDAIKDFDHQAHVFCTLGLSSLEYPVQRIADACTHKLAVYTLGEWLHGTPDPEADRQGRNAVGSWQSLVQHIEFGKHAKSLREKIGNEATRKQGWDVDDLENQVLDLQKQSNCTIPEKVANEIVQAMLNNIKTGITRMLSRGNGGFESADNFAKGVMDQLDELQKQAGEVVAKIDNPFRDVDTLVGKLKELVLTQKPPWLWGRGKLSNQARDLLNLLGEALGSASQQAADVQLAHWLLSGDIEAVRDRVKLYRERLNNLKHRTLLLRTYLDQQANTLSAAPPPVNGKVLWEPDTVEKEYMNAFKDPSKPLASWTDVRRARANEINEKIMSVLAKDVVSEPSAEDWLMQEPPVDAAWEALRPELRAHLLRACRKEFLSLHMRNVLSLWATTPNKEMLAQEVLLSASPFLNLDEVAARAGGFPDVMHKMVFLHPPSPHADDFKASVAHHLLAASVLELEAPSRVIALNYRFRFPLRGVPSVTAAGGLADAKPADTWQFFSRKDVSWIGLTEKELRRMRKAEMLVAIAVLLEIMKHTDGFLIFDPGLEGPAGKKVKKFHASLSKAAAELASETGEGKMTWLDILEASIEEKRKIYADGDWDVPFLQELANRLKSGVGITLDDWNSHWLEVRIARYCAADEKLSKAYAQLYPPSPAVRSMLWKNEGEELAKGQKAPYSGYFCAHCGGLIGRNEAEAAEAEWRCRVNSKHDFLAKGLP